MQKQTPARRKQQKSRNFESRKLKSKTRGQRFHFPFSISAFYFLFSVFVLGLLDYGGWTRLVFRYQRSSLENQFEPTHVGCHLISALVLCVWRPGIGCSLLDVGRFRLPRSVLRSALCALRLALCTALLYHFAVNLQMPPRDDLGMKPSLRFRLGVRHELPPEFGFAQ